MSIYNTEIKYRTILADYIGRSKPVNGLSSWSDLMQVVQKIESEVYDVTINKKGCFIISYMEKNTELNPLKMETFSCTLSETPNRKKIETVFIACIKYLEKD